MTDIALKWNVDHADIDVTDFDLETDEGLESALIISLFTDRLVSTDQTLPIGETSRRGWWGDTFADVPNDLIGSRLWLLNREKIMSDVLARAKEYVIEATQWLIDDKVSPRVDVIVESNAQRYGELDIEVDVFRPTGAQVNFKFNYNWQAQAAKVLT